MSLLSEIHNANSLMPGTDRQKESFCTLCNVCLSDLLFSEYISTLYFVDTDPRTIEDIDTAFQWEWIEKHMKNVSVSYKDFYTSVIKHVIKHGTDSNYRELDNYDPYDIKVELNWAKSLKYGDEV